MLYVSSCCAFLKRWAQEVVERTASEKTVFGEDGYAVHEEYRDWCRGSALARCGGELGVEHTLKEAAEGEEEGCHCRRSLVCWLLDRLWWCARLEGCRVGYVKAETVK